MRRLRLGFGPEHSAAHRRAFSLGGTSMKLGTFPASWTEQVSSTSTVEQDQARIKRASTILRWDQTSKVGSQLEFRVGLNWKSWGEKITVIFEPGKIQIHSRCSFPLQCVDWGKNRQNCLRLAQTYAAG
jgi:hypothetical protein